MSNEPMTRRKFLKLTTVAGFGAVLAACGGATATTPPAACTISERGSIPLPPMPQKKYFWPGVIRGD